MLTISSVDFGWGGSGALAAAVAAYTRDWQDTKVGTVGSTLGRDILPESVQTTAADSLGQLLASGLTPDAHLAVLDAETSKEAIAYGIPTVFVDLLPFLWGEEQREWVPHGVDSYLYQHVAGMGDLSAVLPAHATPIGAVLAPEPMAEPDREGPLDPADTYALLILGGLISPQQTDRDGYVRAVTSSAVRVLREAGYLHLKVIGNLSTVAIDQTRRICAKHGVTVEVGYVPATEFREVVHRADIVLGQPGLMTLLEVSASGRPFVRLPPQNVAGFVQTEGYGRVHGDLAHVKWPAGVIDRKYLEDLRAKGESLANTYCYAALNAYTATLDWESEGLYSELGVALQEALGVPANIRKAFSQATGCNGANQIANNVRASMEKLR